MKETKTRICQVVERRDYDVQRLKKGRIASTSRLRFTKYTKKKNSSFKQN